MVYCFVILTFVKLMAHSWGSLWPSSGKVWQGYGKTIFKLWLSYGNVLEKNMAEFMARGWQIYGKVTATSVPMLSQSFGQVVSRIWQSYDEVMAKFGEVMVKLWFRYGKVYGKAMAELWQRDSEVMVKLWLAPYYLDASNRCTFVSKRCT